MMHNHGYGKGSPPGDGRSGFAEYSREFAQLFRSRFVVGTTQSAVSRAVGRLEEHFNVPLFTRGKSGSYPTRALLDLLPKVRRAIRAVEELDVRHQQSLDEVAGQLRVVGFRSAVSILLPAAVTAFMARHRRVRVSLSAIPEANGGVQKSLIEGRADFGLTTVRPPRILRSVHVGSDPYVVVQRRRTKRSRRECLVLWDERCSELVPQILEVHKWAPLETVKVNNDLGVLAMVQHGAGYTIMPKLATEPLPIDLISHPLPVPFQRDIWLCGRPEIWQTATGRKFREMIVESVTKTLSRFGPIEKTHTP